MAGRDPGPPELRDIDPSEAVERFRDLDVGIWN